MSARGTILVVEDDKGLRIVLDRILRRSDFDVHVAADAIAGIQLAERAPDLAFDLAILNVVLPPPGSAAVLAALRRVMRPLRVLVISGYDEASVRRSGLIAAFGGQPQYRFLEKPFELAMLLASVEELLASREEVIEVATGEWSVSDP